VGVNLQGFKNLEGLICNSHKNSECGKREKASNKKGQSLKPRPSNFYI
jgi:hypothetical protein